MDWYAAQGQECLRISAAAGLGDPVGSQESLRPSVCQHKCDSVLLVCVTCYLPRKTRDHSVKLGGEKGSVQAAVPCTRAAVYSFHRGSHDCMYFNISTTDWEEGGEGVIISDFHLKKQPYRVLGLPQCHRVCDQQGRDGT